MGHDSISIEESTDRIPSAIAPATSAALRQSLNLSGAMRIFIGLTPSPGAPGEGWGEGSVATAADSQSQKSPHPTSPGVPGEGKKVRARNSRIPIAHSEGFQP